MAFMAMVFVFIAFLIVGSGFIGLSLFAAGLITGHENKKNIKQGRGASYLHIVLKALGIIIMLPSLLIVIGIAKNEVKLHTGYKNMTEVIKNDTAEELKKQLKREESPNCIVSTTQWNREAEPGNDTVLFVLCGNENISEEREKMQILIDNGADIERQTYKSHCEHKKEEHPFLEQNDNCGMTPLMCAATICNNTAIEVLIQNGVDLNAVDFCGDTALMHALFSPCEENEVYDTVKLLLDNGADKNKGSNVSGTPLEYAKKRGYTKIAELLEQQ